MYIVSNICSVFLVSKTQKTLILFGWAQWVGIMSLVG